MAGNVDPKRNRARRASGERVAEGSEHFQLARSSLWANPDALRALVQASPLAIITLDPPGNVQLWNPAAERLFGWREEEVLGRPYPLGGTRSGG